MNVPVGITTKAGWGAALTGFVSALLVYLTGDHTAQSVTAVELAGGALLLLLLTHGLRYAQALLGVSGDELAPGTTPADVKPPVAPDGVDSASVPHATQ